ncbi:MAG: division/cell wall cluster transcriptional repressor MraZ [Clostridia bacterium]|nr:division/cell wall cluster transcriptional repressor MraZ [Clostridia bacterium]MCL6521487.1 division/cell wall cluster transcriptional repressor MraZ [Bacillota bacterium]
MLIGEYRHSLDAKGRMTVPARFREELGSRVVLTRGLDRCLFVYPVPAWEQLRAGLARLPFTQADVRAFARLFFAGAVEGEVDRQGRLLIPSALREYAGIEREIAILGLSERVEIWSAAAWEAYAAGTGPAYEAVAERLFAPGATAPEKTAPGEAGTGARG